jgi:hypothetical protein
LPEPSFVADESKGDEEVVSEASDLAIAVLEEHLPTPTTADRSDVAKAEAG